MWSLLNEYIMNTLWVFPLWDCMFVIMVQGWVRNEGLFGRCHKQDIVTCHWQQLQEYFSEWAQWRRTTFFTKKSKEKISFSVSTMEKETGKRRFSHDLTLGLSLIKPEVLLLEMHVMNIHAQLHMGWPQDATFVRQLHKDWLI